MLFVSPISFSQSFSYWNKLNHITPSFIIYIGITDAKLVQLTSFSVCWSGGVMKSCSYKSFCSQANSQGYRSPGVRVHCCYSDDCNVTNFASQLQGLNSLLLLLPLLFHFIFKQTHDSNESCQQVFICNTNANYDCINLPQQCQITLPYYSFFSFIYLIYLNMNLDIKELLHVV